MDAGMPLTAGAVLPGSVDGAVSSVTRSAPSVPSIRVAVGEHADERGHQDLEVEGQAPVVDVVGVVYRPLLDRGVLAQVVKLRPPRDPRPHVVALAVALDLLLELGHEVGTLRAWANKAHLPEEYVDHLGHLVEAGAPQKA